MVSGARNLNDILNEEEQIEKVVVGRKGYMRHKKYISVGVTDETPIVCCSSRGCASHWNELEPSLNTRDANYCYQCAQYVYRVENYLMYKQVIQENRKFAITSRCFEQIKDKIDEESREKLENNLIISKFVLAWRSFHDIPSGVNFQYPLAIYWSQFSLDMLYNYDYNNCSIFREIYPNLMAKIDNKIFLEEFMKRMDECTKCQLTEFDLDNLSRFNIKLYYLQETLTNEATFLDNHLKTRVKNIDDTLVDYELSIHLDFYRQDDNTIITTLQEYIKNISASTDFYSWRSETDNAKIKEWFLSKKIIYRQYCWWFNCLLIDKQLSWQDVLTIGKIIPEIKISYKHVEKPVTYW